MIKNFIKFVLLLIISSYYNFIQNKKDINEKLEIFSQLLEENALGCVLTDEVILVFNYDYIDIQVNELFTGYLVDIKKESSSSFTIEIIIDEVFFTEYIRENYQLKRGEKYEKYS